MFGSISHKPGISVVRRLLIGGMIVWIIGKRILKNIAVTYMI